MKVRQIFFRVRFSDGVGKCLIPFRQMSGDKGNPFLGEDIHHLLLQFQMPGQFFLKMGQLREGRRVQCRKQRLPVAHDVACLFRKPVRIQAEQSRGCADVFLPPVFVVDVDDQTAVFARRKACAAPDNLLVQGGIGGWPVVNDDRRIRQIHAFREQHAVHDALYRAVPVGLQGVPPLFAIH